MLNSEFREQQVGGEGGVLFKRSVQTETNATPAPEPDDQCAQACFSENKQTTNCKQYIEAKTDM